MGPANSIDSMATTSSSSVKYFPVEGTTGMPILLSSPRSSPPSTTSQNEETLERSPTVPIPDLQLSNLRRSIILAIFCLGNFIDIFSFYSALPGIALMEADLGMSVALGSWYLEAPALGIACTSLIGGRLADIFGAKEVYLFGGVTFVGTAIGGALSQTPLQVLLFRGLQGAATGLSIPSGLRGLMQIFPDQAGQRRALAFFSGGISVGIAIGPTAGAGLCTLSWRACYWVCAAMGGAVLLTGFWAIPRLPAGDKDDRPSLDVLGLILITGSILCLVFGLSQASVIHTFHSASVLVPLCLFLPLGVLFFYHETRIPFQRDCLVPPSLWKIQNFVPFMAASSMPYFSWNAFTYPITVYWQDAWGWTPLGLAVHFLPSGIACPFVTAYATFYEHHFKRHLKPFIIVFLLTGMVASLLASFADTPGRYWALEVPSLLLLPFGCVGLQMCCYCGLMVSSPPAMFGIVGALNNVSLQIGVCVFVSCTGLIQSNVDAEQAEGTLSFNGIAWGDRFQVCVAAVVLVVYVALYRTPKVTKGGGMGEEERGIEALTDKEGEQADVAVGISSGSGTSSEKPQGLITTHV